VIAGLRGGVAVVHVSGEAAEQGADAALLVGGVDGVEVRRGRVGPLAAQLGGGGQELGVGDRDGGGQPAGDIDAGGVGGEGLAKNDAPDIFSIAISSPG
jgi:hypothetical protein